MEDRTINVPASFAIAPNSWGHKKFKLKNRFRQLSDADLLFVEGREQELIARLEARLGLTATEIQSLITAL